MKTIVLIPVKNENWILPYTIPAMQIFADHIIVADQMSTDGTREYLSRQNNMTIIDNNRPIQTNEIRWELLEKAREMFGSGNLIVNIDADEMILPYQFKAIKGKIENNLTPGKAWLTPPWVQLWRSVNTYRSDNSVWSPLTNKKPFAFVDDGIIDYHRVVNNDHTSRVPGPSNTKVVECNIPLLHFQFANWNRTQDKQAWYRCHELVAGGNVQNINQKYSITKDESNLKLSLVPKKWYKDLSVPTSLEQTGNSWYVEDMKHLMSVHGVDMFRDLDIWHIKGLAK